jgi:hypothetical protein
VLNLTALVNQLARFKMAEADVSAYLQGAAGAAFFVPPPESACLSVQYDVLFEEINGYL